MTEGMTTSRLRLMDMLHGVLENLQAMWEDGAEPGQGYAKSSRTETSDDDSFDPTDIMEVVYENAGLRVALSSEYNGHSGTLYGAVSLPGLLDVQLTFDDDSTGCVDVVVSGIFWQAYAQCMKRRDELP